MYASKVLLWLYISARITSLALLKIITSLASISVLENLVQIQQVFQKNTLTVPAHVIWEGDGTVSGKAPSDGTLCLITGPCCSKYG